MISFFILDKTLISEDNIKKVLKAHKFERILLRNRIDEKFENNYKLKNCYATPNLQSFRVTNIRGVHLSFFHNKLISKIPLLTRIKNKTVATHNLKEILKAEKIFKPQYLFISPIAQTSTHRDAKSLSRVELFKIINKTNFHNFILLGGMDLGKIRQIQRLDSNRKIKGFAGINGFLSLWKHFEKAFDFYIFIYKKSRASFKNCFNLIKDNCLSLNSFKNLLLPAVHKHVKRSALLNQEKSF